MNFFMKMVCEEGKDGEVGKPSMGRVLCFTSAVMIMLWGVYLTITKGVIPDLPAEWVAFSVGYYGLNKMPATFGGK